MAPRLLANRVLVMGGGQLDRRVKAGAARETVETSGTLGRKSKRVLRVGGVASAVASAVAGVAPETCGRAPWRRLR